ncbi:MAG: hypothetical protein PF483_11140 [Halothiobacillus sp.]|jgi:hypothetical protein|nr:hypothetical protein [Halothiobacillus sp.]
MSKINCNKEMRGFHSDEVTLPNAEQTQMRKRRDAGRTRLRNGLKGNDHALPSELSSQGSYAMRTMVQDSESDYDIDDGVYFEKEDLKDGDAYLSPHAARVRVSEALKDDRLEFNAQVKVNCVRQRYPEGYHIDIPVYRIIRATDDSGADTVSYEHSSGDHWIESDARSVTKWYNDAVGTELSTGEKDGSQLRRVTKLTKKFARSRVAWKAKTASGICLSKLVVDHFKTVEGREGDALRDVWTSIHSKLEYSLQIIHPVIPGTNLADEGSDELRYFREKLGEALDNLSVLDEDDCSREDACKAWNKVFNTTYFTDNISADDDKSIPAAILIKNSQDESVRRAVDKRGGGTYAGRY